MKNTFIYVIALLPVLSAANDLQEEGGGIKELNFSAGATYIYEADFDDSKSVNLTMNVPVYGYIGFSTTVYASERQDFEDYSSSTKGISGSLFLRDSNLGKLGTSIAYADYDYGDFSNAFTQEDLKLFPKSSTVYTIFGQYYFNDFTFTASHAYLKIQDTSLLEDTESSYIGAHVYLQDNTRFLVGKHYTEYIDNNYVLGLSHQPQFLDNSLEVSVVYEHYELEGYYGTNNYDSVLFNLNYYFNTNVSLKERDRQYR